MKFRYLGDKETMTAFGYDFSDGAIADVQDMNAITKLLHNSHFEPMEEQVITIPEEVKTQKQPKKRGPKPRV